MRVSHFFLAGQADQIFWVKKISQPVGWRVKRGGSDPQPSSRLDKAFIKSNNPSISSLWHPKRVIAQQVMASPCYPSLIYFLLFLSKAKRIGKCSLIYTFEINQSQLDMSIRAEARSPSPPSPKNYRAWASFYKPKKNWAFRAKPIWALGILGLSPFGLGPARKPEIYILA